MLDAARNQVNQRLASLGGIAVMKRAYTSVAFGALDQRGDAVREGCARSKQKPANAAVRSEELRLQLRWSARR